MAINPADIKVGFTKAELDQITDSLRRVGESVASYEVPMFFGGPKPSAVLQEILNAIGERCKDASTKGPLSPREAA